MHIQLMEKLDSLFVFAFSFPFFLRCMLLQLFLWDRKAAQSTKLGRRIYKHCVILDVRGVGIWQFGTSLYAPLKAVIDIGLLLLVFSCCAFWLTCFLLQINIIIQNRCRIPSFWVIPGHSSSRGLLYSHGFIQLLVRRFTRSHPRSFLFSCFPSFLLLMQIQVLGADFATILQNYIAPDQLPLALGGTCDCSQPTCVAKLLLLDVERPDVYDVFCYLAGFFRCHSLFTSLFLLFRNDEKLLADPPLPADLVQHSAPSSPAENVVGQATGAASSPSHHPSSRCPSLGSSDSIHRVHSSPTLTSPKSDSPTPPPP